MLLGSVHFLFANEKKVTIEIDDEKHALIAPEGLKHQWYKNGEKIEGAEAIELKIESSGVYSVAVFDGLGESSEIKIAVFVNEAGAIIKIYTIGDSTVSTYATLSYPRTGWGQVLQGFFNSSNVQVVNKAVSGTSSKSFYNTYWSGIKSSLVAGDYVLIQFGHNDSKNGTVDDLANRYTDPKTTYKDYLTKYINETRAKGAIPVLVTSMNRNWWSGGKISLLADYPQAMREVASAVNVPLIDLTLKSEKLFNSLGQSYVSSFIFLNLEAGEYPNYSSGNADNTHFQEMGAIEMARLVAEGITDLKSNTSMSNLVNNLKPQYAINVSANPQSSALLTTRSATYPTGLTVTLKTIPISANTFQKWNDASSTSIGTTILETVFSGTNATSYTAVYTGAVFVVKDCQGILGGTTKTDNCGTCLVNTSIKSCTGSMEAELACDVDGIFLEDKNVGFKGVGYVNADNAIGAGASWVLNSPSAQTATISFRYANGGTTSRDGEIIINGKKVGTLLLPSTGDWTTWLTASVNLNLQNGYNNLSLRATSVDGLANIDQLIFSSGVIDANCVVTGIEHLNVSYLIVYPNPTAGLVFLTEEMDWELFNIHGEKLRLGHGDFVDFSDTPSGLYFVRIDTQMIKIVKE